MEINSNSRTGYEIAVIGMSGIFPRAGNIDEFWDNLKNGVEAIVFPTDEELKENGLDPENLPENFVRAKGGALEGKGLFDASFFGYTPNEAAVMTPQLRKLHECTWQVLENAGYNPDSYRGLIGFYVGGGDNFYWKSLNIISGKINELGNLLSFILIDNDFLATKVSHKLNLRGPSVFMGTACSTSLVAVHMACRALLSGECDIALAGGVAVSPEKKTGYYYSEGMILSPDGYCRAFDQKAKGTIGGNGCGLVALKTLEDAEEHGDCIHAVVKSSVINNDGASKIGFTAPSIQGQIQVIQAALRMAEVEPESISYIETHGTGTEIGDPVEIEALKLAFKTDKKGYCAIGSVKTNVGHLDHAAGVTGVIKTVLALKHRLVPPSLYFEVPNPRIDFIDSPFYVSTTASEWKNEKYPLRAGVSAFGLGGTNAHVILEEYPLQVSSPEKSSEYQLILLSARTYSALEQVSKNLVNHLTGNPGLHLADAAYTLQMGRKAFRHRRMTLGSTINQVVEHLSLCSSGTDGNPVGETVHTSCVKVEKRPIVFVCPEPGNLYIKSVMELYLTQPLLREEMDRCFDIVKHLEDYDIREYLDPSFMFNGSTGSSRSDINQTEITPVLIFIFEYALARLVMKWGINPQSMVGDGVGEYVAACLSGVFSLEQALTLITPGSAAAVTGNIPEIPFISSLTGTWISVEQAVDPGYWKKRSRNPLPLEEGIKRLLNEPHAIFVAVGPVFDSHLDRLLTFPGLDKNKKDDQDETGPLMINLLKPPAEEMPENRFLLTQLGRLWLSGVDIDWSGYYFGQKRNRIPLPTYPFERRSYWLEGNPFQLAAQQKRDQEEPWRKPDVVDWFYIPSWKRSIVSHPGTSSPPASCCWLLFDDECGIGTRLAEQLKQQGTDVVVVRQGQGFAKIHQQLYTINPSKNDDYHSLFEELHRLDKIPGQVVHMWGVSQTQRDNNRTPGSGDYWDEYIDKTMDLCFYSLIYLAQAIGKRNLSNLFQIAVITNNMQKVSGEEAVCPEKALVIGPVRVIPIEYKNISCCSIDIALPRTGEMEIDIDILLNQLWGEFSGRFTHPVIAYRCGYRWEPFLEVRRLEAPSGRCPRLKEGGVYLVTGGLGGIGNVLAEDLARGIHARLILTGRSAVPDREEWPQWLQDHPQEDPVSQKIKNVQALEKMGAEVLVCRADVANLEQMQQVKITAETRFGPINGVIHSAGLADGGVIPLRTRENTDPVLAPKVKGTLVLDAVFKDVMLDFFVSCSSLTSILVPMGQIGYCAANAVQDAYAHSQDKGAGSRTFTGSINWDVWQEVGLGVKAVRRLEENEGIADATFITKGGILNTEGVTVFHTVLRHAFPQTLISTRDLFVRIQQFTTAALAEPEEIASVEEFSGTSHPRPELSTEYEPPRTEFEKTFADILKNFFGYEKVGVHDNFFEFGVTSLTIIRINGLLREAVNKTIPIVSMFENPTIYSLGQYLEQEEKGELEAAEEAEVVEEIEKAEELLYDSIDLLREEEDE